MVKNISPLLKPFDIEIGLTQDQLDTLVDLYILTKNRHFLHKLIDYFEYLPNDIKAQVRIRIKKMILKDIKIDPRGKISKIKGAPTEKFQFQAVLAAINTNLLIDNKKLSQENAIAQLIIKDSSGRALSSERKKKLVQAGLKDIKKIQQKYKK
jgi:hypothetical protein